MNGSKTIIFQCALLSLLILLSMFMLSEIRSNIRYIKNIPPQQPVKIIIIEKEKGIKLDGPVGDFPIIPKTFTVTAYCACKSCCGKWSDGVTANGHVIQPGDKFVAAPSIYPFGTQMIIPGYNNNEPVLVKDRGGAIKGNKLDVFMGDDDEAHQRALNWGVHKNVKVRILKGESNVY